MGKQRLTINRMRSLSLIVAVLVGSFFASAVLAQSSVTPLITAIVTDPLTGVALEGYDPVSYFTDELPVLGAPEYEMEWGGVPWYFASAANRDVFALSPEVYAPMFGGYGTMALARGYLSAGNPRVYAVLGGRLFMFYSSGNKDAFLLAPRRSFAQASENWLKLAPDLISK